MKKKLVSYLLKYLASRILIKYCPRVVVITGSAGKTTAKEMIFTVLDGLPGGVARTLGNLNTKFGVPASIIDPSFMGRKGPDGTVGLSLGDVLRLKLKAFKLLLGRRDYPRILVLEVAADTPGDIGFLMSFIRSEVGVLMNIGEAHLEFFGTKAKLAEEKGQVITATSSAGLTVINADDDLSRLIAKRSVAKSVMVSAAGREADIKATNIGVSKSGVHFNIESSEGTLLVNMPVFGEQFVDTALLAYAVGRYFGVSADEIAKRLSKFQTPAGRFERIELGRITLIDDTYNANPTSMRVALKSLARLGSERRKVAILGDMKELGSAYESGHREVGQLAAETVDKLLIVGEGGKLIRHAALVAGLPEGQVDTFNEAAISSTLRDNDIVLIKGSRAVGMDKIVDQIKASFK